MDSKPALAAVDTCRGARAGRLLKVGSSRRLRRSSGGRGTACFLEGQGSAASAQRRRVERRGRRTTSRRILLVGTSLKRASTAKWASAFDRGENGASLALGVMSYERAVQTSNAMRTRLRDKIGSIHPAVLLICTTSILKTVLTSKLGLRVRPQSSTAPRAARQAPQHYRPLMWQ